MNESEMEIDHRTRFLVVDDEDVWRRYGARALGPFGAVHTVSCLAEARAVLAVHSDFIGLVIDLVLADGSGFDLLEELRDRKRTILSLVLTNHHDRERINRARSLHAEFVCKPPEMESFEGFARRAIAYHWTGDLRVAQVVDALALERELTPREAEIVAAAVAGMPRRLVASEIGVSENTVKVQIRQLLLKCKAASLDEIADGILRKALSGSGLHRALRARTPNE
jgi:DNA-binding NarL/FixJ family response regulator